MADGVIKEKSYISLTEKPSATNTVEWYSSKSIYPRRANNLIVPLINGEQAFAAVAGALNAAKKSIDIISWGFDAAMIFQRPGGERIGDLLRRKGKEGVNIRVLIWHNEIAALGENTVPGINEYSGAGAKDIGLSGANHIGSGPNNKDVGYGSGAGSKIVNSAGPASDPSAARFTRKWHDEAREGELENLEFRTRDFGKIDRMMIGYRQWSDDNPWAQWAVLTGFPSHHQKMVLVDYEDPTRAVGFVMGHNMHRNYWDTSEHLYDDREAKRDPGFGPWQDLSVFVRGQVLHDMNDNFCKAWDRGSPWYKRWFDSAIGDRKHIKPVKLVTHPQAMRSVAQICRTQPQEKGEQSIKDIYMVAAGNARKYVYVENQYFRFPPWAEKLKETRKKLLAGGRDENAHGVCHLFVITNVPDDSGRMNTHRMLKALGHSEQMPVVTREESGLAENAPVRPADIAGLKVIICTLMTSTKKQKNNLSRSVYVHAKLLVVDDAFFTLGSANVNFRSMEVDSELNIASDDPAIAKQWRERLWAMHTGRAPSDDPAEEFKRWGDISTTNATNIESGKQLEGHIVPFFDGGSKAATID